jgi:hypothetical protein
VKVTVPGLGLLYHQPPLMMPRKLPLALSAAVAALALAAPGAYAKPYDIHVFKVTGVSLTNTVKFDVVPTGPGLTEHLTRTMTLSGRPGGRFRTGPTGRNVAFFRENVSRGGNWTSGPVSTVFSQSGSYVLTRRDRVYDQDDNPHDVVVQESAGDCADRKTAKRPLEAIFRVRARRLVAVVTVPEYPELKDCQGSLEPLPGYFSSPTGIPRTRPFSARSLKIPLSYRKATSRKEDGATVSQVVTWKGSVTLTRVKTCIFARGLDQSRCAGRNPDSL